MIAQNIHVMNDVDSRQLTPGKVLLVKGVLLEHQDTQRAKTVPNINQESARQANLAFQTNWKLKPIDLLKLEMVLRHLRMHHLHLTPQFLRQTHQCWIHLQPHVVLCAEYVQDVGLMSTLERGALGLNQEQDRNMIQIGRSSKLLDLCEHSRRTVNLLVNEFCENFIIAGGTVQPPQ